MIPWLPLLISLEKEPGRRLRIDFASDALPVVVEIEVTEVYAFRSVNRDVRFPAQSQRERYSSLRLPDIRCVSGNVFCAAAVSARDQD